MLSSFLLFCLLSILFPLYFSSHFWHAFPSVHESCSMYQPECRLCRVSLM
jgi:hypothetical protein